MHRRVKLKEIGFYIYPTKVAVFFFFLCYFLEGRVYRNGGGEGKGFGATYFKNEAQQ